MTLILNRPSEKWSVAALEVRVARYTTHLFADFISVNF